MEERCRNILLMCVQSKSTNPMQIFRDIAKTDFVRIHGPEHHILDGACLLTAFYNAGGSVDLEPALGQILREGMRMPGAMCGLWGVCGAVTSIGAAFSAIDGTGPLSADGTWGTHMQYTSRVLARMGEINGPRCCKRDAYVALEEAVRFAKEVYGVSLELSDVTCQFSGQNEQCIQNRCPYYKEGYL